MRNYQDFVVSAVLQVSILQVRQGYIKRKNTSLQKPANVWLDLARCHLSLASLQKTTLVRFDLAGCHLRVAFLQKTTLVRFDLAGCHLRVASLETHPYWLFCPEAILVLRPFSSSPCYVKLFGAILALPL